MKGAAIKKNMNQGASYRVSKEEKQRVVGLMIQNFFIWFIPGVIVLAISLVIILVLLGTAVTGVGVDFYKWVPKGLVSFLGIAYLLSGITFVVILFVIPELDAEGVIYLVGAAVICWILAYVAIKMEWQRLSTKTITNTQAKNS